MEPVIERYAPRFVVLSGVSALIVLMAWLGLALRFVERRQHPNPLSQTAEGYLQACQYQLVPWRPWTSDTLEEALRLNRPVAVDVGTFWSGRCAWLGRELYHDSGVADILKREFVPVKLDADASPKHARTLRMIAESLNLPLREPLIVIFTPEGKPITAAAPETRAELMRLLEEVSLAYRNAPAEANARAQQLERELIARWVRVATPTSFSEQAIQRLNEDLMDRLEQREPTDWSQPQPYWLNQSEWLLALAESGDPRARLLLLRRLHALRQSPLWDAQQGGFYSLIEGVNADGKPLGGKRLIENARLLSLYARASRMAPEFRAVADELLDFLREQFWQERPPGFRASVAPSRRPVPMAQQLPELKVDATLYADGNALAILALLDYAELASPTPNPQSPIPNPQSPIPDSQSPIPNPQFPIPNPQSPNTRWAFQAAERTMETLRGLRTFRGDLYHSSRRQVSDWLPDLALVARAAIRLYRYQGSERTLLFAQNLLTLIETDYRDPTGGYYDVSEGKRWAGWTLMPTRLSADTELPADNALVALAQIEFARALEARMAKGEWQKGTARPEVWRQRAERTLQVMLGDRPDQLERFAGFARVASMVGVSF
ncbi:MAG: DUF255 domain-containing protein [Fimbriimonadales bacterium]|nr:DUF255 domain-containing protein [Fimbriimonadales bacterium]